MSNANDTFLRDNTENDTEEDNSDDNLKIVEIPSPKRKTPLEPTQYEKLIIESIEDELEKRLEEKAAKTKLNANHVKNIIKHVVTNEHVLALVKKAENPNAVHDTIPYEPKLTRAKAKELFSTGPIPPVPWTTPKPTSEVQVLFSEDLQEDSSGDEYIPAEEESEDDRDSSIFSDPPSVPPATPPTPTDFFTQTNWSEDGVFKIPSSKQKEENIEEANIARRTRSKLCLSSTPLEVIEEAFIPPDITTDMYDMDCDNDDWMDFLKTFTRPLDEIVKATEDEEQDPEYNILADEEIDEIDKEELRVDKAVKVTRKELNDLIGELFEYADICTTSNNEKSETEIERSTKYPNIEQNATNDQTQAPEARETLKIVDESADGITAVVNNIDVIKEDICEDIIDKSQIPLLEQQMRQHVQLITQNFLLTYQHPELHHYSIIMKEYLLNLKFLCEGKERSMFFTLNLMAALKLVDDWQILLESNSEDVENMKLHVEKTIAESIARKLTGATDYIVTFPTLLLETISKSEVFLYPSLLPKIPFKSPRLFSNFAVSYTDSEDQLIALGLEQFTPFLKQDKKNRNLRSGGVKLTVTCSYIQEYMMPHKASNKILGHIRICRDTRCANNPIKFYYLNKRAPPIVHYVIPLDQLKILPPCKSSPDELPYQWRNFLYPKTNVPVPSTTFTDDLWFTVSTVIIQPQPILQQQLILQPQPILQPQIYNVPINVERVLLPKVSTNTCPTNLVETRVKRKRRKKNVNKHKNTIDPLSKFINCLSQPSHIRKLLGLYASNSDMLSDEAENKESRNFEVLRSRKSPTHDTMLPSMPNLSTPVNKNTRSEVSSTTNLDASKSQDKNVSSSNNVTNGTKGESRRNTYLEFSTISSTSFQQPDTSTEIEFCNPTDSAQTVTATCKANSVQLSGTSSQNVSSSSRLQEPLPSSSRNNSKNEDQSEVIRVNQEGSIQKDNPDDINALMIASSTVKPTVRKEPSGAEKKRAKLKREFLANLSVSTPEDPEVEKQKGEMFALAYYDKMRETLDLEDYHKIMQILNDYEEGDAVDLYKKIEKVLSPKYQELADEFLLFLREKEAAAVGQLIPWIRMNNRSKFLRKLEIYFKDQPAQLRKIYKSLTELSQSVGVSMEKIKSTLLPMFKGNAVISDLFLQNFLDERPPPSLLEGSYETIDISKEMARPNDEEIFESITVPDVEDKYGGPSCICNCHQIEDPEFKSRYRHCIRCGTRFMNGKVYIQTGRGLRPAAVSFLTSPNVDHNIRLLGKTPTTTSQRKKRSETSPSKHVTLSPTKENPEEGSEDDIDGKKKRKKKASSRKKQSDKSLKDSKTSKKSRVTKKNVTGKSDNTKCLRASPVQKEFKASGRKRTYSGRKPKAKHSKKSENSEIEEKVTTKPGATPNQHKRLAEDSIEWEDNAATAVSSTDVKPSSPGHQTAESESDVKPSSPGHQTAESESEFCEESSQDNCESDSNSSVSSSNNHSQSDSNIGEELSWKREEDKIILETFQKENDKEHAFKIISNQLKNRTVHQISDRFQTLMTLLLETLGTP